MTAHADYRTDPAPRVVWLNFGDYLGWLTGAVTSTVNAWGERVRLGPPAEPGQHEAHIGPTGEGKSNHLMLRAQTRRFVLVLDAKGDDDTLTKAGYVRVGSIYQDSLRWRLAHRDDARVWDDTWKRVREGRPARLVVGGPADDDAQFAALRQVMQDGIGFCRYAGGWTLIVDEFEVVSSRELFNLARLVNHMLITARRKKVSVWTGYQAQAWVSKHAIRQARRVTMWPTGDRQMIRNVAEGMGRDWHEVAEAVDQLPQWHTLTIPRGRRGGPMVLTHAPKMDAARGGEKTRDRYGARPSSARP